MDIYQDGLPQEGQPYHSRKLSANTPPVDASTENLIEVIEVTNNLPYSCIIEIRRSDKIDAVHYAIFDSTNKKLIYRVAPKEDIFPSFSIHDLKTTDKEITLVFWPVVNKIEGKPVYYGPIPVDTKPTLGTYELEADFKLADLKYFQEVKPLIEKYYGKAALPGRVRIQSDTKDVFIPSTNTIHLSPSRNNLIHELLHANRKQLLFASKKYQFHEDTELIEEIFAEGVANQIKDDLAKDGTVHGSTLGYNYDFRIEDNALITQNVQSSWGGIRVLENARYFLGSEAYHKIAIEYFLKTGDAFGKAFNEEYYALMQQGRIDPDREMFLSICEQLMPTIEGINCRQWLANQKLFYCTNIPGKKLFMNLRDYNTDTEWLGVGRIYLYETFDNGSDWVWPKGNQKYASNGKTVTVEVIRMTDGKVFYKEDHVIAGNDLGFGEVKLLFHYKNKSAVLKHFVKSNPTAGRVKVDAGLYEIRLSAGTIQKSYYRILGDNMYKDRDKIILATPLHGQDTTARLIHTNKKGVKTVIAPVPFKDRLCTIDVPFIKDTNCEPGILEIEIDDGFSKRTLQRNIGYGGEYGGHQFWLGELTS